MAENQNDETSKASERGSDLATLRSREGEVVLQNLRTIAGYFRLASEHALKASEGKFGWEQHAGHCVHYSQRAALVMTTIDESQATDAPRAGAQ